MISGDEQIRRVLILSHALWEAREEIVDRAEREYRIPLPRGRYRVTLHFADPLRRLGLVGASWTEGRSRG